MTEITCSAEGCEEQTSEDNRIHGMEIQGIPIEVYLCRDHEEQLRNPQEVGLKL